MSEETKIITRNPNPSDHNFILATWLKGNYFGTHFRHMPQDLYFKEYAKEINRIFQLPGTEVRIACDELDPVWIVGFAVLNQDSIYWIHVKRDFRGKGIAKLLLQGRDIRIVKAITHPGRAIAETHGMAYNPL